jgi:radial spoke head protein 9
MAGVTDYTLLADCARGLNVEERCGLTAAITKRQHEEGITGLAFWGKITGTQKDYLVCCAVDTSTDFPAKQFYYCVAGNYELKKLSNKLLSGAQASLAQSLAATYTFSGDPTKPLEEEKTEEVKEEETDGMTPADVTYRELHHLSYIVWSVDSSTSVVPKGAVALNETGALAFNSSFAGLSATDAASLNNFYHFRDPQARAGLWKNKSGAVKASDVLDQVGGARPVDQGPSPVGAWSLSVDASCTMVNIRSLEYPGYFFAHRIGTGSFGGAYFGNGRRNADLAFMV